MVSGDVTQVWEALRMCSDPQLLAYYKACFFLHRRHLFICKRGEEEQGERVQAENIQKFQEKSR